jgi:TolA-binding protein
MKSFRLALSVFLLPLLFACPSARAMSAAEQLRFADGLYLRGLYEAAVGEYLAFLKENPEAEELPEALYRTADCYRHLGNRVGAEIFFRRLLNERPDSPYAARAKVRQATALLEDGDAAGAAGILESLLSESGTTGEIRASALFHLARARAAQGKTSAAEKAYRELLDTEPGSSLCSFAALSLAEAHADKGAGAEEYFRRAVDSALSPAAKAEALYRWGDWAYRRRDWRTAADTFSLLAGELAEEPRARDARLAAAWCRYFLGESAEALEAAEDAFRDATGSGEAAAALYLAANSLRKMNRDGEALERYGRLVRDYPSDPFAARAAYETMLTRFRRGEWREALDAAPENPGAENAPPVAWMKAECLKQLGEAAAARRAYEAIPRDWPESAEAVRASLRLGELASADGDRSAAAARYREAATAPAAAKEEKRTAFKRAAEEEMAAGGYEAARRDCEAFLKLSPPEEEAAEAKFLMALCLVNEKRPEEAGKLLEEAAAGKSGDSVAARIDYWRGTLAAERGDDAAAAAAFRRVIASHADAGSESLARLRLALALQRQEKMDEAAEVLAPAAKDRALAKENPSLLDWYARNRAAAGDHAAAAEAAATLAEAAREAAWRQIGCVRLGESESARGNQAKAEAAWRAAAAEDANTAEGVEARLALAETSLARGDAAEAAAWAGEAARCAAEEATGQRARAYFLLGEAARAAGDFKEAARRFLSVAVLFDDPGMTPRALAAAATACEEAGDAAEAEKIRAELAERFPAGIAGGGDDE